MLLVWTAVGAAGQALEHYPYVQEVRMQFGDDVRWAELTFDDAAWESMPWWQVNPQQGMLWMRVPVSVSADAARTTEHFGVMISAAASYQVFWNGVLIGSNGVPGATSEAEQPGLIDASFLVPAELLKPGENLLALRMSSLHLRRPISAPIQSIGFGPYGSATEYGWHRYYLTLCAAGALLLGAVYFGGLYASNRSDVSSLLLGLLSLTVLLQAIAETARVFVTYPYPLHLLRMDLVLSFAALGVLLLVAYVAYRFVRRGLWLLLGATALAIIVCVWQMPGYDGKTWLSVVVGLFVSALAAASAALFYKRSEAWSLAAAIAAIVAAAFIDLSGFIDRTYFVAVVGLLLFLFAQQVRSLRRTERERERAELRSARMELELLKKHIQPHFLMNTLTVLAELIESNPKAGGEIVEALADELRAISGMSHSATVPMKDELALCRHHLKVMSFRKGALLQLDAQGVDPNAHVPPGVFHTLIENALTHNRYIERATFKLEETLSQRGARVYRLRTPLQQGASEPNRKGGQGHAYVRARLKEAFGEQWRFRSEACGAEWLDEIAIGTTLG